MGYRNFKSPCINCEKRGCGAYHDVCPAYQEVKQKEIERGGNRIKAQADEHLFIKRTRRQV